MNEKEPRPISLCNLSSWIGSQNNIWLGSLLTLTRNVDQYKFPGKLSIDKKKQILGLLSKGLLIDEEMKKAQLIKAEDLQPMQKEFLMEHFLSQQSFTQMQGGEGFVIDETGTMLATINLRDHLTLSVVDASGDLDNCWRHLTNIESRLSKDISFAFSSRFGYLSAEPMHCGTGFVSYVYLHLPALIYTNQLDEMVKKIKEEGVEQTGLQGAPHEIIGDIVVFHNSYTLGVTEENIVTLLRTIAAKMSAAEKSARSKLLQGEHAQIKDKVSRAYAILLHSYQIDAIEALNAISLIKLGLDLGWVTNTTHADINSLLFGCRRAHLLCHFEEQVKPEELPHRRAEYIHKVLKGITLHI